jgi:DegV family protein with EDD domain
MTDSNSELPLSVAKKYDVPFIRMPYIHNNEEFAYDLGEHADFKAFFNQMREGKMPSTVAYPPQHYIDTWEPILQQGKDILFLSFSSKLSAAFSYIETAKVELLESYPNRRIKTVDTKSISGGLALLVYTALQMRDNGDSLDTVATWVCDNIQRANHVFTVGNLKYLFRGGRVSATAAVAGTIMSIKPILRVNPEGALVPDEKVKGRKKSLRRLAQLTIDRAQDPENNAIVLVHGDCEEDALFVKELVEKEIHFKEWFVQYLGPVIGSHAGPDTISICFLGKERD